MRKIKEIRKIGKQKVVELQLSNTYYIDETGSVSHNCKFCKQFWHDGGSFKIYRLSELTANGSNVGKKQANWLPTIEISHPHCRHRLMELLPGWTLDENGSPIYVSPNHHEFDNNLSELSKVDLINEKLDLLKAKALPVGTIRQYGKYKFIKHVDGWVHIGGDRHGTLIEGHPGQQRNHKTTHSKHNDKIHGKFARENMGQKEAHGDNKKKIEKLTKESKKEELKPTIIPRALEEDIDSKKVDEEIKEVVKEKDDIEDVEKEAIFLKFENIGDIVNSDLKIEEKTNQVYQFLKERFGRGGRVTEKTLEAIKVAYDNNIDIFADPDMFYSKLESIKSRSDMRKIVNVRLYGLTGVKAKGSWSQKHIPVLRNFEKLFKELPIGHVEKNRFITKIANHANDPKKSYAHYRERDKIISLSENAYHSGKTSGDLTKASEFNSVVTHEVGHAVSQKLQNKNKKLYEEFGQLAGWSKDNIYTHATGSMSNVLRENERLLLTKYSSKSVEECFAEYYSIYFINKDKIDSWLEGRQPDPGTLMYRDKPLGRIGVDRSKDLFQWIKKNLFDNPKIAKSLGIDKILKSLKNKTPTFSGYKLHKRIKFQGMDISVENRKGSYRHWKDRNGDSGKTKMQVDYGYIRKTLSSADGDHVDVFVGPNGESERVFIIHQVRPDTGKFDEDKVMLGFDSKKEAKEMYLKHYNTPKFFGSMDEMDIDTFKEKVIGKKVDMIKAKLESISRK